MPLRYPSDDPAGTGTETIFGFPPTAGSGENFSLFHRPCVYSTRIDQLPVNDRSDAWRATLDGTAQTVDGRTPPIKLQRNYSYQFTGYQPYLALSGLVPTQTLYVRKLGPSGQKTSHPERFNDVPYPIGDPFSDQGSGEGAGPLYTEEVSGGITHTHAHPDSHVIAYDPITNQLWEIYGYIYGNGPGTFDAYGNPYPNCYMAKRFLANRFDVQWTGATADESGQIIYPMLPKYSEIVAGLMPHCIRFNAPKYALRADTTGSNSNSFIWPARNGATSGVGLATDPNYLNFLPMGAWARLKASYDISGFRTDTQVFLTCLKNYGMILSDIGESWSMVGTANEQWPAAMLAELITVPTSAIEFIEQSWISTSSLKAFGDVP